MQTKDFSPVTEQAGHPATREQLERMKHRYSFAAQYARGKSVLEVACGPAIGLGAIAASAKRAVGLDLSFTLVEQARRHYGARLEIVHGDAQALPFEDGEFDTVILYEAIYYIPDADKFFKEANRVLAPAGMLIVCSVNPEWPEFSPSAHSAHYFSAQELEAAFHDHGFSADVYAAFPVGARSAIRAVISAIRRTAARFGLIPKTLGAREFLKRVFYGRMEPLPQELRPEDLDEAQAVTVEKGARLDGFKIIYVTGKKLTGPVPSVPTIQGS